MGIMHTLKQKFMKQRARAKIFRRTTLTNDYKSKCEFSIFRLNFTTIAGSERRRKRKMFTYGTARFSLHLITLICCYIFASVHVKFIQLNLSKFWRNMNCLFIPFSPFASPFLSLSLEQAPHEFSIYWRAATIPIKYCMKWYEFSALFCKLDDLLCLLEWERGQGILELQSESRMFWQHFIIFLWVAVIIWVAGLFEQ